MAQKKINQSLVDYNLKLRELNNIQVDIPQKPIRSIIKDPKQYGIDFLEATILKHLKSNAKAHKLGKELAKENLDG